MWIINRSVLLCRPESSTLFGGGWRNRSGGSEARLTKYAHRIFRKSSGEETMHSQYITELEVNET